MIIDHVSKLAKACTPSRELKLQYCQGAPCIKSIVTTHGRMLEKDARKGMLRHLDVILGSASIECGY